MAKGMITGARPSGQERPVRPKTASKRVSRGRGSETPAAGFWRKKSIEQLAAEQGVKPTRVEDILGKGAHLWESDEDLENFVLEIYERRKQDLELSNQ